MISKTPNWITDIKTTPLQDSSKTPMGVRIEVMGIRWGAVYHTQIKVRLDESETRVNVSLKMQRKP
jgi:hypothetical protein